MDYEFQVHCLLATRTISYGHMYLNIMSDALMGKAVYSLQECLLKMMKECREKTVCVPLAREFLFLETGQSVKLNPVVINTPFVEL